MLPLASSHSAWDLVMTSETLKPISSKTTKHKKPLTLKDIDMNYVMRKKLFGLWRRAKTFAYCIISHAWPLISDIRDSRQSEAVMTQMLKTKNGNISYLFPFRVCSWLDRHKSPCPITNQNKALFGWFPLVSGCCFSQTDLFSCCCTFHLPSFIGSILLTWFNFWAILFHTPPLWFISPHSVFLLFQCSNIFLFGLSHSISEPVHSACNFSQR